MQRIFDQLNNYRLLNTECVPEGYVICFMCWQSHT